MPSLELALRLDPEPIAWWIAYLGQAYYLLGRYEDSASLLERFESRFEEDPAPLAVLAAAQAQLGRQDRAEQTLGKLRRTSPFFNARLFAGNLSMPEHAKHLLEGMRKAGLE